VSFYLFESVHTAIDLQMPAYEFRQISRRMANTRITTSRSIFSLPPFWGLKPYKIFKKYFKEDRNAENIFGPWKAILSAGCLNGVFNAFSHWVLGAYPPIGVDIVSK
jgi:hypothetical protein